MRRCYINPLKNATEDNRRKCFKQHGIKDHHDPYHQFRRINFERFRPILMLAIMADSQKRRLRGSNAGRPSFDPVFMLMVVFIQVRFNWPDDLMEALLRRDLCLKAFLGTWHDDDVPSAKTIWRFREMLSKYRSFEHLFDDSIAIARMHDPEVGEDVSGMDSSFALVPVQHFTEEEKLMIEAGRGDELWLDHPHKKCHKDIHASWTYKGNIPYFGYKGHMVICLLSKLIMDLQVTPANVHDATTAKLLIENLTPHPENVRTYGVAPGSPCFFADAGYKSTAIAEAIRAKGWRDNITERIWRNGKLTDDQKHSNKLMSSIRARVEHVFGYIERSMGGFKLRSVGKRRANSGIAAICFVYNMCTMLRLTEGQLI